MGDDDRREGPSLELPSWGLRRRRRARAEEAREPDEASAGAAAEPAETREDPEVVPPPVTQAPPAPPSRPEPEPEPARPLFVDEAPTAPLPRPPVATETTPPAETRTVTESRPADTDADTDADADAAAPVRDAAPRRAARRRPSVHLGGLPAAVLTGVVVGLLTVVLTWASQRGCEALRGTSSCGGGPGFLLLLAIMVAMVFLGAGLLRLLGVPGPGSTSFLGMGLLAVITLLFFVGVIFDWWMAIVVPVCAALTYALSHWVTATYAEPER